MLKTVLFFSLFFVACTTTDNKADPMVNSDVNNLEDLKGADAKVDTTKTECAGDLASVTNVSATGTEGNYQFSVTIKSPDTGCDQYANWWEVLDENGKLVYRRILGHSHVDEQPFTRSGGPANVKEDAVLFVRAHMNPGGYGTTVFKGSVKDGFTSFETACGFAPAVETEAPLPTSCAF